MLDAAQAEPQRTAHALPEGTPPAVVAIVDNNPAHAHWLRAALRPLEGMTFQVHLDSAAFLACLRRGEVPAAALVDYGLPGRDGLQVGAALSHAGSSAGVPWILMTGLVNDEIDLQARALGAAEVLTKPMHASDLRRHVRRLLQARDQSLTSQLREAGSLPEVMLFDVLARVSRLRDDTTGSHVLRMARYAVEIARELGKPADYLDNLLLAAPLHDIGKIGVPDRILNKRGPLDADEMLTMRRHPAHGAAVLRGEGSAALDMARRIAGAHHERWDGKGYPEGLAGEAIPLEARIVAVADVFDALTTRRPYKQAWAIDEAVKFIREGARAHFDAQVVEAFTRALPQILDVMQRLSDPLPDDAEDLQAA